MELKKAGTAIKTVPAFGFILILVRHLFWVCCCGNGGDGGGIASFRHPR